MNIHLIAVGTRMPDWVRTGYAEFSKRMPRECSLVLKEISTSRRSKNASTPNLVAQEGERMLAAIPKGATAVALDERGSSLTTRALATKLKAWLASGSDLALLVGGPDGLAPACLERAAMKWSLSELTLPHALVRVLVAEQLYRAWSLIEGHPYHRD